MQTGGVLRRAAGKRRPPPVARKLRAGNLRCFVCQSATSRMNQEFCTVTILSSILVA